MASTKTKNDGALPDGFTSPFQRVEMKPGVRIDDGLACVAMLAHKSLEEITNLAIQLGLPEHGPAWVYPDLLRKLLFQFDLIAGEEAEARSVDALPDVALVLASYDTRSEIGRWCLWVHVRGTEAVRSFSFVLDPAYWIPVDQQITRDFKHLLQAKGSAIYYLEVSPKPRTKAK